MIKVTASQGGCKPDTSSQNVKITSEQSGERIVVWNGIPPLLGNILNRETGRMRNRWYSEFFVDSSFYGMNPFLLPGIARIFRI